MVVGDMVAGVCYSAAAEQVIRRAFHSLGVRPSHPHSVDCPHDPYQPTVIGYMVETDDAKDELVVRRGDCGDECECWAPEGDDE